MFLKTLQGGNFKNLALRTAVVASNAGMIDIETNTLLSTAVLFIRGVAFRRALPIIPSTYQSSCRFWKEAPAPFSSMWLMILFNFLPLSTGNRNRDIEKVRLIVYCPQPKIERISDGFSKIGMTTCDKTG